MVYRITPGPLDTELCKTSYFATLKKAGYRTGHIGKEHVSLSNESAAVMFDVRRKLGRNPFFKKQADGSLRHETQILGDWAIEFLDEQPEDQPFCLTVSFNATHAEDGNKRPGIGHYPWPKVTDGMYEDQQMPLPPLNAPAIYESQPDFLKRSINRQRFFWRWDTPEKYQTNMRAYFRMISGIDHVMGRLVSALEKRGLADNTVIIYSADNGYYLGDRGFAGKWTHYEQSLRVPLIIHDPRLPEGKRGRVLPQMQQHRRASFFAFDRLDGKFSVAVGHPVPKVGKLQGAPCADKADAIPARLGETRVLARGKLPGPGRISLVGQHEGAERAVLEPQDECRDVLFFIAFDRGGGLAGDRQDVADDVAQVVNFVDQVGQNRPGLPALAPVGVEIIVRFAHRPETRNRH